MKCDNIYCVYWKNNQCIYDDTEIDLQGRCILCKYVDVDENTLRELRESQRKNIEPFEEKYRPLFHSNEN